MLSGNWKARIYVYFFVVLFSIIFTVIVISEYGHRHEQLGLFRLIVVSCCVFAVTCFSLVMLSNATILKNYL